MNTNYLNGKDLSRSMDRKAVITQLSNRMFLLIGPLSDDRRYQIGIEAVCTLPAIGDYLQKHTLFRACQDLNLQDPPDEKLAQIAQHLFTCTRCIVLAHDEIVFLDQATEEGAVPSFAHAAEIRRSVYNLSDDPAIRTAMEEVSRITDIECINETLCAFLYQHSIGAVLDILRNKRASTGGEIDLVKLKRLSSREKQKALETFRKHLRLCPRARKLNELEKRVGETMKTEHAKLHRISH